MQKDLAFDPLPHSDLLDLTAALVASYVSRNLVPIEALPDLIRQICAALQAISTEDAMTVVAKRVPQPAVSIRKSVFPDHIVCLEDGQKLQALKRHLRISHGLTPGEHRQRWGLPPTYPMVSPDYAARRVVLAKKFGLGRKGRRATGETSTPAIQRIPEGKRGGRASRQPKTA